MLETSCNDFVYESELFGLAERQIMVLDCCSGRYSEIIGEAIEKKSQALLESADICKRLDARKKYETLCMNCPEQELKFYAAEIGQKAKDTNAGGLYTKELIKTLINAKEDLDIVSAHDITTDTVRKKSHYKQHPDKDIPKIHRFLPGAIIV